MTWTPAEWHGSVPAREVDHDARAEMLVAEMPAIVASRQRGAKFCPMTEDEAAKAAEDASDPFHFIALQEARERDE